MPTCLWSIQVCYLQISLTQLTFHPQEHIIILQGPFRMLLMLRVVFGLHITGRIQIG